MNPPPNPENEAVWREVLTKRHPSRLAFLPSRPRCIACQTPFRGIGGLVATFSKRKRSRKNPNFCNYCEDVLPPGGAVVDTVILFADIRGSTAMGEKANPEAFAATLNRFYAVVTEVLTRRVGMVDKLIGDEVMGLFIPSCGPTYRLDSMKAAEEIMRELRRPEAGTSGLSVGIAVHSGPAFVGRIGTHDIHDFTALGDTVNTCAKMQEEAAAGEILCSEKLYQLVSSEYPNAPQRALKLPGREQTLGVRVLRVP